MVDNEHFARYINVSTYPFINDHLRTIRIQSI